MVVSQFELEQLFAYVIDDGTACIECVDFKEMNFAGFVSGAGASDVVGPRPPSVVVPPKSNGHGHGVVEVANAHETRWATKGQVLQLGDQVVLQGRVKPPFRDNRQIVISSIRTYYKREMLLDCAD